MIDPSAETQPPTIGGSSADWAAALIEQGFDGLSRLTSDIEDVRAARARYHLLRSHVDAVIHGADRIEFVVAAACAHRSGKPGDALVIVTDSMVIVSGTRRAVVGERRVTDIFSRAVLTVTLGMFGPLRAIELHADGRRATVILPSRSSTLEAAFLMLDTQEHR